MSSDGTSTPDGDAERFAAALDGAGAVEPEIARQVALDPDPQARERALKRLLAALAEEKPPPQRPPRAS